ncbi:DUF1993 domain-containing protein [Silvimonas iriomotensis]|uniref:DUF1993 domain-containing protein n=1 Tax=Silvimonas iriomotensis TaxID=449662 RepID=A0ABQ2PEM0_9NEIS|nr:DUF1993 domain-containing protein [Silvimonas iriomotensis]GGP23837.1 hypothetical protein GCM10010970_38370 [Silvimonas iriomotensis]
MAVSMYRLSIPVFQRGLQVLASYVDKAEAHAKAAGVPPEVLVHARIATDMLPLAGQIQRASDTSKNAIGRLVGIDVPSFPDCETTFGELKTRILKTQAFFATITPEQLDGTHTREVTLDFSTIKTTFTGDEYLMTFVLPNFYFHIATAHAILRQHGLDVGKLDYLGPYGE